MNEYVSVTVWKHSEPIDWADMQAMLTENMNDQDAQKGTTVRWFEIDENTHGSVLTYPSKEAFKKDIEKNTLYVYKNKLRITGCISICADKDEEYEGVEWITKDFKNLYLHRLAVHPECQKKGIGRSLMDFAEEYAKLNGFKSVRLDTFSQNQRNNKFYKSRQYVQLGDVFFPMQSKFPFHCYEKIIN